MDTQTIGLCVIDFLLAVVVWLIKDSQHRIEKRIDRYARKNEAEHANFSEALAQHGREYREALAQFGAERSVALAQHGKEYREALAQQRKENREALAQLGAERSVALAQRGKEFREALAQQRKENREALAQLGAELTALRVEVAELTVPTERELLDSLRQLTMGSGLPERKLPEGD